MTRARRSDADALMKRVAAIQDTDPRLAEERRAVRDRLDGPPTRIEKAPGKNRRALYGLVAVAAVAASIVLLVRRSPPLAGTVDRSASASASASAPSPNNVLRFPDGSTVALANQSFASVEESYPQGARVRVDHGDARVTVVHRDDTRWAVEAGPYVIHVTGTAFDVGWVPGTETFHLEMVTGSVIVEGPGLGSRRLVAGENLIIRKQDGRIDVRGRFEAEVGNSDDDAGAGSEKPTSSNKPGTVAADGMAEFRALFHERHYEEAFNRMEQLGWTRTCETIPAADLLSVADAARLSAHSARARETYGIVRRRFPGSNTAATASFFEGRVAADQDHDWPSAVKAFRTYLRERPNGELRELARGRLIESLVRSGDQAGARVESQTYLSLHPDGAHATLAKQLTAGAGAP